MTLRKNLLRGGAAITLFCFGASTMAQAAVLSCATSTEISAIQITAVHQELTDAALACGPNAVSQFNRFQLAFQKELRRSDAAMLSMFKRLYGVAKGNAAYDAFKTRAIAHAEMRRTQPGAGENFCKTANIVFAAALAPDKPLLEDFVAGVPVSEAVPVDSCQVKVSVTLQGVAAGPDVMPSPRPSLPGDPPSNLFP